MRPTYAFLDAPLPLAFAHRGGAADRGENTLAAFGAAVDLGYAYVETDVRATADGRLVIFHDATLGRLTGSPRRVDATSWRELSAVDLPGGGRVPLLEDVLGTWPRLRVNVDVKSASAVRPMVDTLHRTGAVDRVCVASFDDRRTAAVRAAVGDWLCTSLGRRGVLALRLASLGLPCQVPDAACAQVPLRAGGLPVADRRFVERAHRLGLQVHVWTLDEPEPIDAALDIGVDGVMTDRPAVLRAALLARGAWHGASA